MAKVPKEQLQEDILYDILYELKLIRNLLAKQTPQPQPITPYYPYRPTYYPPGVWYTWNYTAGSSNSDLSTDKD